MAFTGKKRAFADAVLAGFSNKEAAIRAAFSKKTASVAGSRNVKDPDVKAYLDQCR
jgi:phage terminase small subunit